MELLFCLKQLNSPVKAQQHFLLFNSKDMKKNFQQKDLKQVKFDMRFMVRFKSVQSVEFILRYIVSSGGQSVFRLSKDLRFKLQCLYITLSL